MTREEFISRATTTEKIWDVTITSDYDYYVFDDFSSYNGKCRNYDLGGLFNGSIWRHKN